MSPSDELIYEAWFTWHDARLRLERLQREAHHGRGWMPGEYGDRYRASLHRLETETAWALTVFRGVLPHPTPLAVLGLHARYRHLIYRDGIESVEVLRVIAARHAAARPSGEIRGIGERGWQAIEVALGVDAASERIGGVLPPAVRAALQHYRVVSARAEAGREYDSEAWDEVDAVGGYLARMVDMSFPEESVADR